MIWITLDLSTATPRQVDAVLEEMGATPSTVARSRTFFLNAAEEAGIEVGRTLKTAPRAPTAPRRARRAPKSPSEDPNSSTPNTLKFTPNGKLPPVVGALLAKVPAEEAGWDEVAARQWLTLLTSSIAFEYGLDLDKLTKGSP